MVNVMVIRNIALPVSETFIATQLRAMERFHPVLFCHRQINTDVFGFSDVIELDESGTLASKFARLFYYLGFGSPRFTEGIRTFNPVLIHAHGGHEGTLAVRMKAKHRIPLVTTFHGHDATARDIPTDWNSRIWHTVHQFNKRALIHRGDLFVAVSEEIRTHLIEQGFPEEKVKVLHLGVDLEGLFAVPSSDRERATKIISVGRLVEKKGTTDLIAAFAKLNDVHPEYTLDIVGEGPLRSSVIAAITQHNLSDKVTLHGALPFTRVHQLIANSMIFCLPSKVATNGDKEGLPIAILEAMALGTPVVSTWHSGIPEAVIDGETGILVNEGDVDALADSLIRIADSSDLWESFARLGRERVEVEFDTRTQTNLLEREFERLVNS